MFALQIFCIIIIVIINFNPCSTLDTIKIVFNYVKGRFNIGSLTIIKLANYLRPVISYDFS